MAGGTYVPAYGMCGPPQGDEAEGGGNGAKVSLSASLNVSSSPSLRPAKPEEIKLLVNWKQQLNKKNYNNPKIIKKNRN